MKRLHGLKLRLLMLSNKKLAVIAVVVVMALIGLIKFGGGTTQAADVTFHSQPDCNGNAIINCGAMSVHELISKYAGSHRTQMVYNYFGFGDAEMYNMINTAVAGSVTKNGDVYANGQLVATGAITAGFYNIPGSTPVTYQGVSFFKRPPSVSFLNNALDAYVVMDGNGQFKYAILASCGNPVVGTPLPPHHQPQPAYNLTKEVQTKGGTGWAKSVTVSPGTHVIYRITVTSTGDAPVTNLNVRDTLPADTSYVLNTLQRDGTSIEGDGTSFFNAGTMVASLAPGSQTVFTFEAIIGPNDTPVRCVEETLINTANSTATNLPNLTDTATVSKHCVAPPTYSCDMLTPTALTRTHYSFKVTASAQNGATITGYTIDFGDHTTPYRGAAATTTHTYQPGNWNAVASVTVAPYTGAPAQTVTGIHCQAPVSVASAPLAECTNLTFTQASDNEKNVTATAVFTVSHGAALKLASFNFGDGSAAVTTNRVLAGNKVSVNHVYTQFGDFDIIANLTFNAPSGDTVPASVCRAHVTFTPPQTPPVTVVNTPPTPTQIPNTGAGNIVGIFALTTVAGMAAYRLYAVRKLSRS